MRSVVKGRSQRSRFTVAVRAGQSFVRSIPLRSCHSREKRAPLEGIASGRRRHKYLERARKAGFKAEQFSLLATLCDAFHCRCRRRCPRVVFKGRRGSRMSTTAAWEPEKTIAPKTCFTIVWKKNRYVEPGICAAWVVRRVQVKSITRSRERAHEGEHRRSVDRGLLLVVSSSRFLTSRVRGVARSAQKGVHASRIEVETASRSKSVALQSAPGSPSDLAFGE